MTAHDAAQATVESLTDQDFADLPTEMQAELIGWWTRFIAWREQRHIVIDLTCAHASPAVISDGMGYRCIDCGADL